MLSNTAGEVICLPDIRFSCAFRPENVNEEGHLFTLK